MSTEHPWELLSKKIVYKNRWITVHEDAVKTPTGSDGIYGYIESNDSVIIVALNDKDEMYLVRRYVYPHHKWTWGLPGGGGDKERSIVASKRELEEETGILAKTWDWLGETTVCDGLMTEHMTTYLARDLSFSGQKEYSDEQIEAAKFFSKSEITDMIRTGKLDDGQVLTALQLFSIWQSGQ
jgi:8-oxo-dGTP pyrophosphatase MutT (NUDIX family)